ncbi:MAG: polysaccharide pyruvyl transferase family protein [Bacteroidales bacterium]|nr:polysaccharide pyruvyl transferase family protein [Bacteroidales bacterium]
MRIGILTFQYGYNYGAIFQCYALQKYLEKCNHDVRIINYIPPNIKNKPYWKEIFSKHISIVRIRKILKKIKYASLQKESFDSFRNRYLNLTDFYTYDRLSNISDEFDAIIVGSDQIWNPSQHNLGSYFLSHLNSYYGKRISYAPCCAFNKIESHNKLKLASALDKFQAISVRNEETAKFVLDLTKINPPIVVDPVLLWDFNELINNKPLIQDDYIFTYILGSEIKGRHKYIIERIKKNFKKNICVVTVIQTENNPQIFKWPDKIFYNAHPIEWLNLLYYSSFVYTDSFHGVLFSLKFNKSFIAYYNEMARASRFIDLIHRYTNLKNYIVESFDDAIEKNSFREKIDYIKLNEQMKFEIDKSIVFLKNSLI